MDRWLIRNPEPQPRRQSKPAPGPPQANEGDGLDDTADSSSDILMAGRSESTASYARSVMRSIRWTPINHPWRRNSHNAALFDSPVPEGAYLTQHLRLQSPGSSEAGTGENVDGDGQALADDEEELAEDDDQIQRDEAAPVDDAPAVDYAALHKTCSDFFAASPYFLVDERLLTVAGLYTNGEIVEKVNQLHYPPPSTSAYNNQYITARLCDSITRVAHQRGVPREVVKGELDRMRKVNGVFERQVKYNFARRKEEKARREAEKRRAGADAGAGMNGESMDVDGSGDKLVPETGTSTTPKKTVNRTLPYGLGTGLSAREPVVVDSDEDDEEL